MTQTPTTLGQVIATYQQRGHRLWNEDPHDPADISMLVRLSASKEAAKAFTGIPAEAKKALVKRLGEEEKAFAKGAEKAAKEAEKKFFAKKAEEAAKALRQ